MLELSLKYAEKKAALEKAEETIFGEQERSSLSHFITIMDRSVSIAVKATLGAKVLNLEGNKSVIASMAAQGAHDAYLSAFEASKRAGVKVSEGPFQNILTLRRPTL